MNFNFYEAELQSNSLIHKRTSIETPHRKPQECSRTVTSKCLPASLYSYHISARFLGFLVQGSHQSRFTVHLKDGSGVAGFGMGPPGVVYPSFLRLAVVSNFHHVRSPALGYPLLLRPFLVTTTQVCGS